MPARYFIIILLASMVLLASPGRVESQPAFFDLSNEAQISLITIAPGDQVYSLFGHSALRVYDPLQGIDISYNYGTFDFGNPLLFTLRFTYGKLDYMLASGYYVPTVRHYRDVEKRPMIEQVLTLSKEQKNEIFRFLQINALPENRTYRYDFLFDNCSTRIRDALERTLGEAVTFTPEPDPGVSFRELLDPYLKERPELDLGIDLLLGMPVDRIALPREAVFLPDHLMESFDHAMIEIHGEIQPLVARKDTVFWFSEYERTSSSFRWPTFTFIIILIAGVALSIFDWRNNRERPWVDIWLFGLAGVAGMLISFLWFISEHSVTENNLNIIWAWPTHLIAAIALSRKTWSRAFWLRPYFAASTLLISIFILGWPFWPQGLNVAILPFVLLLTIRGALQFLRRRRTSTLEANPVS